MAEPLDGEFAGYQHTPEKSAFWLGDGSIQTVYENGFNKNVGPEGVISRNPVTGAFRAIPNAGAASTTAKPYGSTADEHNSRVLDYFLAAGLPKEQVRSVVVHTLMDGFSPTTSPPVERSADRLVAHYSLLNRALDGIPILDSIAWARFNENDRVVSESVYWPPIPASTVAAAAGLKAQLDSPGERAAFLAKLPPNVGDAAGGAVVIRHTSSQWRGTFHTWAVYQFSVKAGQGSSYSRRFDANGVEVRLPEELRAGLPDSAPAQ